MFFPQILTKARPPLPATPPPPRGLCAADEGTFPVNKENGFARPMIAPDSKTAEANSHKGLSLNEWTNSIPKEFHPSHLLSAKKTHKHHRRNRPV